MYTFKSKIEQLITVYICVEYLFDDNVTRPMPQTFLSQTLLQQMKQMKIKQSPFG